MKRPGSESVGYALKMANVPCIMNVAKRGSCLLRVKYTGTDRKAKGHYLNLMQTGAT